MGRQTGMRSSLSSLERQPPNNELGALPVTTVLASVDRACIDVSGCSQLTDREVGGA